jgi:hypothetical protein
MKKRINSNDKGAYLHTNYMKQMILKNPKEAIKLVKSDAYYDKYGICVFCLLHDVLKPNQVYDFIFSAANLGAFDENKNI